MHQRALRAEGSELKRLAFTAAIVALFVATVVLQLRGSPWAHPSTALLAIAWPVLETRRTAPAVRARPGGARAVNRVWIIGLVMAAAGTAFWAVVLLRDPAKRTLAMAIAAPLDVALLGLLPVVLGLWYVEWRQRKAPAGVQ